MGTDDPDVLEMSDAQDAKRYRFLRDAQVYDTGMAVAVDMTDYPKGVRLCQGPDLDPIVDAEMERYRKAREAQAAEYEARRRHLSEAA